MDHGRAGDERPGEISDDNLPIGGLFLCNEPTSSNCRNSNGKREDYLSWDEQFMTIAIVASQRSKDPVTQVGAVIVNDDRRIVATGYNGFPNGCSDDRLPWGKNDANPLNNKYPYVVHAEANAIMNTNASAKGCTLYSTLFPCNECAKSIIQAGIRRIVYLSDKREKPCSIASKIMLDMAGIEHVPFESNAKLLVDFTAESTVTLTRMRLNLV